MSTIEDIEMELSKIHGGVEKSDDDLKNDPEADLDDSNPAFQSFSGDMVDSGAIDHSSDEEYQPDERNTSGKGFISTLF